MYKAFRFCFPFAAASLMLCAGLMLVDASAVSGQPNAGAQGALLVTTLEDELNADGDCSLREAIQAANTNAVVDACGSGDVLTDTITFKKTGTIALTEQLSVTTGGPLLIDGTDAITISGGGSVRVFYVNPGAELMLQSLVLTNGQATFGGGIYNESLLTITNSTLSGNSAYDGGAIYNFYNGTLTITNSTLSDNSVGGFHCVSGRGGGIYNEDNGKVTVSNSTLSGNSAVCGGGGITNWGTLTIKYSTLSGNTSTIDGGGIEGFGGGIMNFYFGTLTIAGSTLSGNSATEGGGIHNGGTLTITDSILSGNSAFYGGGIDNWGMLNITSITLSGNIATYGGGIFNQDTLTSTNSTLSGNSSDKIGGGIYNYYDGTLSITNSTLSGNTAVLGGGIVNSNTLTITNSIVANSLAGGDCYWDHPLIDGGHNLSSDNSCGFDPANGSLPDTDPRLGPLQGNGGRTWTHALLWDSPAIDAADDAQCPATDQRGMPRPFDGDQDGLAVCDIGSFEFYIPSNYLPLIVKD